MRERLIKLTERYGDDRLSKHIPMTSGGLADYLLANGVIVPPVSVGSLVYVLRWKRKRTNGKNGYWNSIIETDLQMKSAKENGEIFVDCKKATKSDFLKIGKTIFLTREEAERALKGDKE